MNENNHVALSQRGQADTEKGSTDRVVICPDTDILELAHEYLLRIDLPGASKADIHVSTTEGSLLVEAPARSHHHENAVMHLSEISPRQFRRKFILGSGVGTDRIEAKYHDGVLTVRLPKTSEATPREISIS